MFPILSLGDRFDEVIDFMNLHKSKKDLLQEVLILLVLSNQKKVF
jgi:hypothetical protein